MFYTAMQEVPVFVFASRWTVQQQSAQFIDCTLPFALELVNCSLHFSLINNLKWLISSKRYFSFSVPLNAEVKVMRLSCLSSHMTCNQLYAHWAFERAWNWSFLQNRYDDISKLDNNIHNMIKIYIFHDK